MTPLAAPVGDVRVSASVEETERLGERLAPALELGDLLVLSGPLGAGKTRFVAGLARGLGAAGRVRSPSFILINEYRGRLLLLHVDLYRVGPMDVDGLGLEEEIGRGALVVEWGEKLGQRWREEALVVAFEVLSAHERRLSAGAQAGRGVALLEAWRRLAGAEEHGA